MPDTVRLSTVQLLSVAETILSLLSTAVQEGKTWRAFIGGFDNLVLKTYTVSKKTWQIVI